MNYIEDKYEVDTKYEDKIDISHNNHNILPRHFHCICDCKNTYLVEAHYS